MKLKKGDTIKIIKGKDCGKSGKIIKVLTKENKIIVEGLNLFKKHVRPKKQGEKGEIVFLPRPVPVANVLLVCSACGKTTRISYVIEGGDKFRQCIKCKARIN